MPASAEPPPPSAFRAWIAAPLLWITAPLAVFIGVFTWNLWPEWSDNPDLSHGLFAPVIFALLVRESVLRGTRRWLPDAAWSRAAVAAAALGAVVVFAMAGLLAASLGWTHSLVRFLLAATLTLTLGGGWLLLASDRVRAVPLNWPALTAIGLWMLAAPLPPGTYARLTLELQAWVTSGVLNALHILGIPARQAGNVIQLANTSVGVEEACSGIRSLLSCLYAGFFFAAWLVRRPGGRVALILAAPVLAIVMNYFRSLTLTLLANRGINIDGFWHDATGFAILGVTAVLLALLANWFGAETVTENPPEAAPCEHRVSRPGVAFFLGGCSVVAALGLFFLLYQRPSTRAPDEVFEPDRLLPAESEEWRVITADDLYQFADTLQTNHLVQRTYLRRRGEQLQQLTVYVAHWAPGQAPVSMVASHTPDACWPGSGWVSEKIPTPQLALDLAGRALPPAEYRFFTRGPAQQHVWFWHIYDGRVINYRDPYSVPALLEIALRYGFRREGSQYFVRLSSNLPWNELEHEPLLVQLQANLERIGLRP